MTWSDSENALQSAREQLAERYPDESPAILQTFDIAWSGWDGDCKGALIARGGVPELIAIDQTIDDGRFEFELVGRLVEYRRLIDELEAVLQRYRQLRGSDDAAGQ